MSWDEDQARIRDDRDYFGRGHVNDTFPAHGAAEWQWTLGEVVTAIVSAGMEIVHLGEYSGSVLVSGRSLRGCLGRTAAELVCRGRPPVEPRHRAVPAPGYL